MKKRLLFCLVLLFTILTITGCNNKEDLGSDGRPKETFEELKYEKPKDYVKVEPYNVGEDVKTRIYRLDNTDENINIYMHYDKGKSYQYITSESTKYAEKEINGTKWRVMHSTDFGVVSDIYYVVYNNNLYQIELNGIDKNPSLVKFMDTVSFK